MLFRRPFLIHQLPTGVNTSIALLAGMDGLARSSLASVLPLVALHTFGSKDVVATIYFASTIFTLLITLNAATLERVLQRRGLVTLGGLFLAFSVLFFQLQTAPLFALGIGIRSAGASIFAVCLSLYIMDHIGKAELTRNESRRMLYVGGAWLIGPALGSWIAENSQPWVAYTLSAVTALVMLGYFWRLRLGGDAIIRAARSQSKNPLSAIVRYMSQPRLRIAYLVTLSRACFWAMLFVYGPIYVVEAGLPAWLGGVLLSGASGLLFLSPLVQRLADRFGTRQVLIACSILIGTSMIALGLLGDSKPIGLLFLITGSIGGAAMDVLGNIPFMRLVKPRERTEMTMVFTTWRESSSLLTQALVFLTLLVAPFWVFYFLLGLIQFATAVSTTYLPKRL